MYLLLGAFDGGFLILSYYELLEYQDDPDYSLLYLLRDESKFELLVLGANGVSSEFESLLGSLRRFLLIGVMSLLF